MKTAIYKKGVKKVARRMALGGFLLFFLVGSLMAQYDSPFVIKKDGNYLAHVGTHFLENDTTIWNLQNVTAFDPATCLWYSGPTYNPTGYTHNYYFEDDAHNLRFLAAPLEPTGALSLSASLPSVSLLRNTDQVYYFYNWDPETHLNGVPEGGGVARGKRYYVDNEVECVACGHGATWHETDTTNHTFQCWEVYWIENVGNEWKLSSASSYNITGNAAHYRKVTITEHEKNIVSGGLTSLTVPSEMNSGDYSPLSAPVTSPYSYIPAYTNYVFLENGSTSVHNYWGNADNLDVTPTQQNDVAIGNKSYEWTISGDGVEYLSFAEGSDVNTTTAEAPTLYYRVPNNTGHKTATITVTVTYTDDANNEQTTQTRSATVLVKTPCQNPSQAAAPVVTYTGVTVSWVHTADSYTVSWKKASDSDWESVTVGNVTSYTLMGLEYETAYQYKVTTECGTNEPTVYNFTTSEEPGLMVVGSIFGGGRMANVTGNTEVVIVNCDSVGGIYGGNDIAGAVQGSNGSKIILGVNAGGTYASYGTTPNNATLKFGSVYGGGNGYYAYNGTSFVPATENYTSETVAVGASVKAMTQSHTVGDVVWTNTGTAPETLDFPSIVKTEITVSGDYIQADSIFGGAKNAFLTLNDDTQDGSLITVNGGTIMAVFGGNNFGGDQGYGKHHIVVNGTTTNLALNIQNTPTAGYGRDFGIRYLFGGGNKVYGSKTNVEIFGGQTDNVFGGGNSADVYAANVRVDCSLGAYSSEHPYTYGNTYTNAIPTSYASGAISIKEDYPWDGKGIYNIRNLYGGNNMEHMASVPTVTLTSGSVGTVYGGGNAGDMLASSDGTIDEDGDNVSDISFDYSTKVILDRANIIVDYVYGGCRMSNVDYSTWVQIQDGHVGTVFGGCNVSGDVGSTRVNPSASGGMEYQEVQGGTYVEASGGTVYKNIFAGGNGFYHCNENFHYKDGIYYTDENYVGKLVPTHNETHAIVKTGASVKGNVYAGGNLAPVGFQDNVANYFPSFPVNAVGWAVVHIYGGTIEGNVFGGGNMADVYGSNDVMVAGGTIAAVYGGNDRTGQVGEFSNRVLPPDYSYATDEYTKLITPNDVRAYVRIVGTPTIQEVYGGGNGDYDYEHGDLEYCNPNEAGPIQSNTFVDIHIDGGSSGGHIGTVYGGGDGVTASGFIYVFININEPSTPEDHDNVGTVFGGNNKGDLALVPNIILLHGQVGTVYGGCNEGAMTAATGISVGDYTNVGSYVHLRDSYAPIGNPDAPTATPDIKISNAVYGGCRMNGVTRNSLVLVEGGDFSGIPIFGGSDISGTVSGDSRVAVVGGTVGKVYGGGNGHYTYDNGNVYTIPTSGDPVLVATGITTAPICAQSGADILGGRVGTDASHRGEVFGGGYGELTSTTGNVVVNVGPATATSWTGLPVIYGEVYGGSALGTVNTDGTNSTTVNFLNGTLHGSLFGGGLGEAGNENVGKGQVNGKVYVSISNADQLEENCFIDLRDADVYGCNNTNGSPKDDVRVDVYKTAYNFSDYTSGNHYTSQEGEDPYYAIDEVFGGGNQADYTPTGKKTLVYVHDCRNTIKRVFSGGNAAAATGVSAIIEGGRFDYIFGGGNGEVSAANIGAGGTDLTVSAGIINHLFGGSNQQGVVSGSVITDINGSNYVPEDDEFNDPCNEEIAEVYGGSNAVDLGSDGHPISIETTIECGSGMIGTIYGGCNQADITGNVSLTVQGGTFDYVYGGSKGVAADGADISGDVTLNLEGGTIRTAFGGSNVKGNIGGRIIVNVIDIEDCPLVIDTVFGGGNHANYEPYYSVSGTERVSPLVNVMHIKPTAQAQGIRGCVFGGGNEAWVTSSPRVNIGYNATDMPNAIPADVNTGLLTNFPQTYVKGKIFGGGNNITAENKGVEGNTRIYVYNGQVCQNIATGEQSVGIYGGCNTSGTVTGNSHVAILGGTIGNSTTRANIHGGGFGSATEVKNNVTVDFGAVAYDESGEDPVEIHTDEPKLYGDLYGGSALGNVNHNNTQTTTVNILNGEITGVGTSGDGRYGNVFGGGLGDADHDALVHGRVFVNVGACDTPPSSDLSGKAKLIDCNIFGCNNISGSPQDSVYVHVYQTDHIEGVNTVNNGDKYAILRVYGGGNLSNYAPENNNPNSGKKTHVYVHSCDNTIKYVFGGSNAAAAVGVQTLIEGGRFDEIYGGGNGTTIPANIGLGGIGINVNGGHARYYFEGNNHLGNIDGPINQPRPSFPAGYTVCGGNLIIDSYYFGDNEAEHYGDLEGEITCEQGSHFNYKYVFAGSRWAIVYGDIKLTVKGGNIQYLYGGSKGYGEEDHPIPADVRRFPSYEQLTADDALPANQQKYSSALKAYMRDLTNHPERAALVGHGGNIVLTVQGGTIGDVIGGCEELGNVEGKITVIIDALDDTDCPLVLGNVYGASKQTDYVPTNDATHHAYYEPTTANAVPTPQVKILKGTVGSVDSVTFIVSQEKVAMEGNVFGGGDIGNVTANPKVIVGESSNTSPVEILGNVYGGGKEGSVDGSPEVIIVPNKHTLTIIPVAADSGAFMVTNRYNTQVNTGAMIDEYQDLNLKAIPSAYGFKFDKWVLNNGTVLFENSSNTIFTMGTNDASIKAHFVSVPTHTLTIANQGPGSVTVTDGLNVGVTNYASIGEGAVLNLLAEPTQNSGYAFLKWVVTGTGSFVANEYDPNTTFTMGTANTTVTAVFKPTHQLTIATHQEMEHGSITVIDILGRAVHTGADIAEGAILTIVANPDDGYEFVNWTVTNGDVEDDTAISTTFVMGNDDGDASISAIFNAQQTEPEP